MKQIFSGVNKWLGWGKQIELNLASLLLVFAITPFFRGGLDPLAHVLQLAALLLALPAFVLVRLVELILVDQPGLQQLVL